MDTDELSEKTYEAILSEAERFHHDLTLQFGLLAQDCKDEQDYIHQATKLIEELKTLDEVEIDDLFFGEPPPNAKEKLNKALIKILENMSKLKTQS